MASPPKQPRLEAGEMDQSTAQQLFHEGGMLVFLDVPPGTEFGIDYNTWNTGQQFKGVKMIPPGVHFVFFSAVNSSSQSAPRTGFFHNFHPREVVIKKWDPQIEGLSTAPVSVEEQQRVESNRRELDRFLGAYPYESYKKWVSLTSHLTPDLVERLQPSSGLISSVAELHSPASTTESRRKAAEESANKMDISSSGSGGSCLRDGAEKEEAKLPDLQRVEGTEVKFSKIPKQKHPTGASPAEISQCNLDHSFVLQTMLDTVYKQQPMDVLGEIQMAFICFLLGQLYEGFEQWKHLVHMMCSCETAVGAHNELFNQFISILHYHIREIPEDFFVDIVTRNNFLVTTLREFFYHIEQSDSGEELKKKAKRFKENLEKRFSWDFSTEDEDDQPVIVELT